MNVETGKPARVLDPVERTSEVIFGLLMAVAITGSLSVATAGRDEVRTMMAAALGCNLAWGLADAVMYVVRALTERRRNRRLLAQLRAADAATGQGLLADALPPDLAAALGAKELEVLRRRLSELPYRGPRPHLGFDDYKNALGVFLLVVIATFPVVLPFMVIDQAALALRVSHAVALAMLFVAGAALGRYATGTPWLGGAMMMVIGGALMAAIIALGG